jgi:hypothetical protein
VPGLIYFIIINFDHPGAASTSRGLFNALQSGPSGDGSYLEVVRPSAQRAVHLVHQLCGFLPASVSYVDIRLDHHIGRRLVSPSLKLLDHLGLIEVEPGPRLVNVFRFSNRWRSIDEVEAQRLAALAREVKPHRRFVVKGPGKVPRVVEKLLDMYERHAFLARLDKSLAAISNQNMESDFLENYRDFCCLNFRNVLSLLNDPTRYFGWGFIT